MKRKIVALITVCLMAATGLFTVMPINAGVISTVGHNGPWAGYIGKNIEFEAWTGDLDDPPYHWIWTFYHWSGCGEDFTVHHNTSIPEDSWSMPFLCECGYRVKVNVTNSLGYKRGSVIPINHPNLVIREPIDLGVEVYDLWPWYWIAGKPVYFVCNVWGEPEQYIVEDGYEIDFYIKKAGSTYAKFFAIDYTECINLHPVGFYHTYGGWWPPPHPSTYEGPFIWEIGPPGNWYVKAELTYEDQVFDNNPDNDISEHMFEVHGYPGNPE